MQIESGKTWRNHQTIDQKKHGWEPELAFRLGRVGHLQVVSRDAGRVVASVRCVLDVQASLAGDGMALDSSQQLRALASEHRADDQLEHAFEFRLEHLARGQFFRH